MGNKATDGKKYLGPTWVQLTHLFVLLAVNSMTVFTIFILLVRSCWTLAVNTTTIESWEIERHEALVRRARHFGGFLDGPGGVRVRIQKQGFPYDIGIWANIKAGMGSGNVSTSFASLSLMQQTDLIRQVVAWFLPLARTPDRRTGLSYPVNEFEGMHIESIFFHVNDSVGHADL